MANKGLSLAYRNLALDAIANGVALTLSNARTLHLHNQDPTEDGNNELSGDGYAPVAIAFSAAVHDTVNNRMVCESDSDVTIASVPSGVTSHWSIQTTDAGGNTVVVGYGPLNEQQNNNAGDRVVIPNDELDLFVPNADQLGFSLDICKAILDAATVGTTLDVGTLKVSLHTSDPGTDGSANEFTGNGYARQSAPYANAAAAGIVSSSAAIVFTNMPSGTASHFAIWQGTGGADVFVMRGALDSPVIVNNNGSFEFGQGQLAMQLIPQTY